MKKIILVLALAISFSACHPSHKKITLGDINNIGVTGALGQKLGTIITVTGVVEENSSEAKEDEGEPFFLSITAVNGNPLKAPVKYPFRAAHDWIKIETPKIGDHFDYVGYETGSFDGSPDGEFKYAVAYTSTGYYFKTSFLILK
jgi:hypothetical protein